MKKLVLLATIFAPITFAQSDTKQVELTYQIDNSVLTANIWLEDNQPTVYKSITVQKVLTDLSVQNVDASKTVFSQTYSQIESGLSVNITPVDQQQAYVIAYEYKGAPQFSELGEYSVFDTQEIIKGSETVTFTDKNIHCFDDIKTVDDKPVNHHICLKLI